MNPYMTDPHVHSNQDLPGDFYRRVLDRGAVAVLTTDNEGRIVSWNQQASETLGRPPEEVIGRMLADVVPAEKQRTVSKLIARTRQRNLASQFELTVEGIGPDPKELLVTLSPVTDAGGEVCGVSAWIIDQTDAKRLAEKYAQAEKMASLGTLAGGVAHHFNNILGGVATFVDYALTTGDPVAMKRALQMTAEASGRVSKITQSLLSFAKHDSRGCNLADLTEVVLTFAHLVEQPLQEQDIRFRLELNPIPILAVESSRMHQVLGNLLTNAEEAMPSGGDITIAVDCTDTEATVSFTDTGSGISDEDLANVFEPFFTTKGTLAGGDQSNPGLGLSVAHGIIMDMGGRITVSSHPGQGTTFTIYLPLNRPEGWGDE
jgi:PAS domain S-box-containing protein